jgi:hypothetical protein
LVDQKPQLIITAPDYWRDLIIANPVYGKRRAYRRLPFIRDRGTRELNAGGRLAIQAMNLASRGCAFKAAIVA